MASIDYAELSKKVSDALRAMFTDLLAANPDRSFYTFAIWTDDSLQFASAAANTEEGLVATVQRYRTEVDPKYDTTSTRNNMRWAHGDWEFFPVDNGEEHLSDINAVLQDNCDADEDVFAEQIEPLWQVLLDGFLQLEKDGFFGTGEARSKITLLLVGDLDDEIVDHWATVLNPPDVAERYITWDCEAPDTEVGG
jgi:hypothetical protein